MTDYQISSEGREEAIKLARKFKLNEASMVEARRLLEERQAAAHADINANIRAATGRVVVAAAAQPEAAPPVKRADAHAGAGATQPGVPGSGESVNTKMNRWLRNRGRGEL